MKIINLAISMLFSGAFAVNATGFEDNGGYDTHIVYNEAGFGLHYVKLDSTYNYNSWVDTFWNDTDFPNIDTLNVNITYSAVVNFIYLFDTQTWSMNVIEGTWNSYIEFEVFSKNSPTNQYQYQLIDIPNPFVVDYQNTYVYLDLFYEQSPLYVSVYNGVVGDNGQSFIVDETPFYTQDFGEYGNYEGISNISFYMVDLGFYSFLNELKDDYINSSGAAMYNRGFTDGYNHALDEYLQGGGITEIFSGILSVGVLPINIFLGMFNFEILGINLSAFVSALLSVAIVVIVVRLVTGKKDGD